MPSACRTLLQVTKIVDDASAARAETRTEIFGQSVDDPHRWLEDSESAEVQAWTAAQNERTLAYVNGFAGQAKLRARVHELLGVGYAQSPSVRVRDNGERRYFHTRREGDQVQPVLLVRDGHDGVDRVLIDVAALSSDGTDALDWWYPSHDGSLVAWGRSEHGSEQSVLHVRDVASGQDLDTKIPHTLLASVVWVSSERFFYTRHPTPGDVPKGDEHYYCKVFEHVIGRDFRLDPCVFGDNRDKTDVPSLAISPDRRWLVVRVHKGWDKSEVYVRDLARAGAPWREVAVARDALFEPIPTDDALYMMTNEHAPRYRLMRATWEALDQWSDVLTESTDVLTSVAITPQGIFASVLRDASSRIVVFDLAGKELGSLRLPALGSADVSAPPQGGEVFVDYTSFVVPFESLRAELPESLTAESLPRLKSWDRVRGAGPSGVTISREFATSKDGTRVPMFIVRGGESTSPSPTVLYGYGGFNVNLTPAFSARALAVVEHGGVWVSAVLRGGGEYGEAWHRAGMLENKQHVFDDVIACAESLIASKTTTADKLAIMGGSNGGLLVAAAVTQRPELFRAGAALVPLTDMLRYHLFRLGAFWIPEYGSPEEKACFEVLYAYSPYHHVRESVRYPAMLFTSAESDTRVDPLHARKMAARMSDVEKERAILLFVETRAGHGQGKPTTKLEDDLVMQLSFVFRELGV